MNITSSSDSSANPWPLPPQASVPAPTTVPEATKSRQGVTLPTGSTATNGPRVAAGPGSVSPKINVPTPSSTPDLTTLLRCVLRHWMPALGIGVVLAAVGAAGAQFAISAKYKATAMVRLGGASGLIEKPNETSNAQREFRSTQQELLRMPHVLKYALELPEVRDLGELDTDPDSIDELNSWLTLELPRSSEILRISVQHNRAKVAQVLANAVTDAYLREVRRQKEEDLDKRVSALDKLHDDTETRLGEAWSGLQKLARQLGAGDPAALSIQVQAEVENYRAYSRRLREIRAERREAERVVKAIRESSDTLTQEMPEDASMHSVKYAMFQVKLKKEQALRKWGERHPDVLAAQQEEDLLREFYQKSSSEKAETTQPKDRKAELLAEPLSTIARLTNEEDALTELVKQIEARMELLGGDSAARLEILRNDINRMEKLSDRLWTTRESLQVERHADQRVQLVTHASVPNQRDVSKRNKMTVMAGVGGLGFVVFLAGVLEFLTGRVHSRKEAETRAGLVVVGSLPSLPATLTEGDGLEAGESGVQAGKRAAQLDQFVANLLHHPWSDGAKTFLITSARHWDERAQLATQLAATLARSGRRTALVGLDFRVPEATLTVCGEAGGSVASLVEAGNPQASADQWDQQIRQACITSPIEGLNYLPPGRSSRGPLSILMDPRLSQVIAALERQHDFVILDAPGVAEFPDALHVGRLADVAVLALRINRSTASSALEARNRLLNLGLPVIGTVLAS